MIGEFAVERFGYDNGRRVTVYLPSERPEAIVYAADGQRISKWGRLLAKAGTVPTMIVGVHSATDETRRLHEYSPGFEPECFAAHERFFVEEVRRWTQSRFDVNLPKERLAVFGASAGGELALALGLRHPQTYGTVFCASRPASSRSCTCAIRKIPRSFRSTRPAWHNLPSDSARCSTCWIKVRRKIGSTMR